MNNQNFNQQPVGNQPMNNRNYNGQPMNNQNFSQQPVGDQPMNNQQINNKPKKKNLALIIGLSIVGVFVLGIIVLFIMFSISANQDKPWKSGQVQILGKNIQLPCEVSTFESTLNTEIIDGEYSDEIKKVKISLGYNSVLIFDVYVENNIVTGIMLDTYESDETDEYKTDPYSPYAIETERDTALNMVFPGNLTIESSIDNIKELYNTKPLNVDYVYWDEKIGYDPDAKTSAGHKWQNSDWSIEVHTMDGEIIGIDYYYLGN